MLCVVLGCLQLGLRRCCRTPGPRRSRYIFLLVIDGDELRACFETGWQRWLLRELVGPVSAVTFECGALKLYPLKRVNYAILHETSL